MIALLLVLVVAEPVEEDLCGSIKTIDLEVCAWNRLVEADKALNATWAKLQPDRSLRRAQRAWIAWRNAECDARGTEGREANIRRDSCFAELTEQRQQQLEWYYDH